MQSVSPTEGKDPLSPHQKKVSYVGHLIASTSETGSKDNEEVLLTSRSLEVSYLWVKQISLKVICSLIIQWAKKH